MNAVEFQLHVISVFRLICLIALHCDASNCIKFIAYIMGVGLAAKVDGDLFLCAVGCKGHFFRPTFSIWRLSPLTVSFSYFPFSYAYNYIGTSVKNFDASIKNLWRFVVE